jgi:RNA polymerase sigma-70 factor (ECF subfamily)
MAQSRPRGEDRWAEAELVGRAVRRDETAVRAIIQKHNRRLYRVARSIQRDDAEAEDAQQDAYLNAYQCLESFRGDASLSTWLTRIVANEALQRLRRRRPTTQPTGEAHLDGAIVIPFPGSEQQSDDPERTMAKREICQLVEHAIDELPQDFRTVLVARVLEGMSVEETAQALDLKPETVKTRLHRARRLL